MKQTLLIIITIIAVLWTSSLPAQALPEGAIARLGKGCIGSSSPHSLSWGSDHTIAYSPNGKLLAVASYIGVWLYDAQTYDDVTLLDGHTQPVDSVSFSPNGKMLASGSYDNTIKLWDMTTFEEIITLRGHTRRVPSVSFSPDGKMLASGSGDETIKLWDTNTFKEITTLRGHNDWVYSVSFSPDGKLLASGSRDKTIKLWDMTTLKEITTLQEQHGVRSVSCSPDGKLLASISYTYIKLWDMTTFKEITTLQHTQPVDSVSFSPNGKMLASGSSRYIKLWDMTTFKEITTLQGHTHSVYSVSFSPDGKMLASGSTDETIKLWDMITFREITTLLGHTSGVESVSFSPNRKMIAIGSTDKTIKLWDTTTFKEITTLRHIDQVHSVSFSPDGKLLASGSWDGGDGDVDTIKLWDMTTFKEVIALQWHTEEVRSVSFSPNGKLLASGSDTIKLWDMTTFKEITTLHGHTSTIYSVSFSPDGKVLASGSYDNTIKLWDMTTFKEITTLQGHTRGVSSVSFSPNGKLLASGSFDDTIKLWDMTTFKEITTLRGHNDWVHAISFSPDGSMLASGSSDNTIKLWDITDFKEIDTLQGHTSRICSVSFSPDGSFLASGSWDGTVLLWKLTPPVPELYNIFPTSSPREGGTEITLTGHRFLDGATVTIGGKEATDIHVNQQGTEIAAEIPVISIRDLLDDSELKDVTVTNPNGQSDTLEKVFQYYLLYPISLYKGWNLISLPGDVIEPSPDGFFGTDDITHILNANYKTPDAFELGEGYWALAIQDTNREVKLIPQGIYTRELSRGWNLIGSAYGEACIPEGVIQLNHWNAKTKENEGASRIEWGIGYWALVLKDGEITVDGTKPCIPTAPPLRKSNIPPLWVLPIQVMDVNGIITTHLTIGIHPDAKSGFDSKFDVALPPPSPGGDLPKAALLLDGDFPLRLTKKIQTVSKTGVSEFRLQVSNPIGDAVLSWDAKPIPDDWSLSLIDQIRRIDMAQQSMYSLPKGEREIVLLINFLPSKQELPQTTALLQNYPNPFNPETWIPFRLAEDASVKILIYDLKGRFVRKLDLGRREAGSYMSREKAAFWDGRNEQGEKVASGVYIYQMILATTDSLHSKIADKKTFTRRMVILK